MRAFVSFSVITLLLGLGFQVSTFQDDRVALALWILSGMLAVISVLLYLKNVIKRRRNPLHSPQTSSDTTVRLSILSYSFAVLDKKGGRLFQAASRNPLDLSHFPPGHLELEVGLSIQIYPQLLVENMQLQIDRHVPIDDEEWHSERMETEYSRDLRFIIPVDIRPGEHDITVLATIDGKSYASSGRTIQFPQRPVLTRP